MVDWIPFVSQVKSLIQVISGDEEGARRTQENFSKQMPVVSQIRSLVESASGDNEAARETQLAFAGNLSNVADAMPGIGHIKGGIHHAVGDHEGGNRALLSATRTAVVVGTGIVTGGVGAVGAGLAYDGVTTAITGENQGFIAAVDSAVNDPNAGNIFDATMVPVGDFVGGKAGAKLAGKFPTKSVPLAPENIPLTRVSPRPSTSSGGSSIASGRFIPETIRHRNVPTVSSAGSMTPLRGVSQAVKHVVKTKVRISDMFSGASARFSQLMYPLALSPYVKHFSAEDKFYEMTLYRYYHDMVQGRVVRAEDPPSVPVRVIGDFTPNDGSLVEMDNGFLADDYGDIVEYYSNPEKQQILNEFRQQPEERQDLNRRYRGVDFRTADAFLRHAQQPRRRPNGSLRPAQDFNLNNFLHVRMPEQFNYTGAIMTNSESQGLLHSFFRHHTQWRDHIPTLDINPLQNITADLNAIENVQNNPRQAVTNANRLIARIRSFGADEQIDIYRGFANIQASIYDFIQDHTTFDNYMGENVNNNGYVQVYFRIPGTDQVMVVCVSNQLYPGMPASGNRRIRTITTIFFTDEPGARRRIRDLTPTFN